MNHVEYALRHLGINTDPNRGSDDSFFTSVIDLSEEVGNYAYVTVVHFVEDRETLYVVCVSYPEFDTPQTLPVHCSTVMQKEMYQ